MEEKLDALTEKLVEKLERAIDELDSYVVTTHVKEKTVEYDDEGKKPVYEKTEEKEVVQLEKGIIDRAALKQLVSTLRELKGEDGAEHEGVSVFLSEDARELAE